MRLRVLVACSPGEQRVAVVRDDTLLDYAIHRPGAPDGVGDLHRGRVESVVPSMAGAFVALADAAGFLPNSAAGFLPNSSAGFLPNSAAGFLPDSEGARGRTEGEAIGVRIIRAAQGGKGPRLTARVPDDVGAGPPCLLARGPGAVERLAALYPDAGIRVDDMAVLTSFRPLFGDRLSFVGCAFDPDIEAAVEALSEPDVVLSNGARLSIHPTPTLVAIDVDTAAATGSRRGKDAHQMEVNRAVLPDVARQIRLRNLSGAIVVDLAGLTARRRGALGSALADALGDDPLHPKFLGFTALGLAEIVRPRVHPPLHEVLAGPHAAGLAALRQIRRDLHVDPRRLPALRASPAVTEALHRDPVALADLARAIGRPLTLRSDPALPNSGWIMEAEHA